MPFRTIQLSKILRSGVSRNKDANDTNINIMTRNIDVVEFPSILSCQWATVSNSQDTDGAVHEIVHQHNERLRGKKREHHLESYHKVPENNTKTKNCSFANKFIIRDTFFLRYYGEKVLHSFFSTVIEPVELEVTGDISIDLIV